MKAPFLHCSYIGWSLSTLSCFAPVLSDTEIMEQIQLGNQVITFDREQTIKAYSALQGGDAERCGCAPCLNFAAQRKSAYPENFCSLLDQLGIDFEKEGEVFEYGPEGELHLYGGWFYFVGEIITMGERLTEDPASGFQYWFADAKRLPKPAGDFGDKIIAVEFVTKVPWILAKR
jgi:hypothetical protein